MKTLSTQHLRRADFGDAEAVTDLSNAAYRVIQERIGYAPLPMIQDYAIVIARDEVWLLESADDLLDVLVLVEAPDQLLIYSIAIVPERQGKGLGQRLMTHAEDQARSKGQRKLQLFTNVQMPENIAFCRRLGYRETGRAPHPTRLGAKLA